VIAAVVVGMVVVRGGEIAAVVDLTGNLALRHGDRNSPLVSGSGHIWPKTSAAQRDVVQPQGGPEQRKPVAARGSVRACEIDLMTSLLRNLRGAWDSFVNRHAALDSAQADGRGAPRLECEPTAEPPEWRSPLIPAG
jgi:hypothetical protein